MARDWPDRPTEPVVREDTHVRLGRVTDVGLLVDLIRALPEPATIFIEGTDISDEALALYADVAVPGTRDDLSGTLWPASDMFHVALGPEVLARLDALAQARAVPELFDHVAVYRDDALLLAAYDAAMDDVWVSRALPSETLDRLRALVDS